jgi:hypothetical protein
MRNVLASRRTGKARRHSSARHPIATIEPAAALDASALHLNLPRGARVFGTGLAELQLLNLGSGRDR